MISAFFSDFPWIPAVVLKTNTSYMATNGDDWRLKTPPGYLSLGALCSLGTRYWEIGLEEWTGRGMRLLVLLVFFFTFFLFEVFSKGKENSSQTWVFSVFQFLVESKRTQSSFNMLALLIQPQRAKTNGHLRSCLFTLPVSSHLISSREWSPPR